MKTILSALFILCFLQIHILRAQQTNVSFETRIVQNFQQLFDQTPQEKVYLHLDKSNYTAGEYIWLKAYPADATFHVPNLLSKFVYVELIDRQDSIRQRIKLKQTDSCFYGDFKLTPDIAPGDYCIRAYTNWMQNNDEAYFFKKNITIVNPSTDVNIHSTYKKQGESVNATFTFANNSGVPYSGQRVKISLQKNGKTIKNTSERTDDKGSFTLIYQAKDSINNFELSFPYDLPFAFKRMIYPREISTDFDLQFFPEGGCLLSGATQTIAFKAIRENGCAVEIEGDIFDSKDSPVAHIKTTHRGMGQTTLQTHPNEHYYAIAKTPNGTEKRISLPSPENSGYALKAQWQNDTTLLMSILFPLQADTSRSLFLLMHTRGRLIDIIPVNTNFIGAINTTNFPAGISHFVLTDTDGTIYSQRLCFIAPSPNSSLELRTDKNNYGRREAVTLSVALKSPASQNLTGNFSVSVTDNNTVIRDSVTNNIVSYFLLSSDLKGYIEAPGSYINAPATTTDLLMLTHGWTRFRVKDVIDGRLAPLPHPLELNQQLKGWVTNYSDKPMSNARIQVFVPSMQTFGELKANNEGKFTIKNISFPDSTLFLIRAFKEKGSKQVDLGMYNFVDSQPHTFFPQLTTIQEENTDEFLNRFKGDFYYQDGVKIYILGEVTVTHHRSRKEKQKYVGEYTDMTDQILGQNELSKFTATSIYQLLMRLPGVFVSGENVSIRGGGAPLFLLDGTPVESDFISGIMPEDVDNIGVIKDGTRLSFFGSRGGNGAIVINTKRGEISYRKTPGLIKYRPLGYLQPDEFYMPRYDKPEEKSKTEIDYRSTIYWNPVVTTDSAGRAEVSFFTADFPTTYTVTVEGITPDGQVYHNEILIRRE